MGGGACDEACGCLCGGANRGMHTYTINYSTFSVVAVVHVIGKWERANLVVSTGRFFYICTCTYVHICDPQCGSTHTVTFTSVLT